MPTPALYPTLCPTLYPTRTQSGCVELLFLMTNYNQAGVFAAPKFYKPSFPSSVLLSSWRHQTHPQRVDFSKTEGSLFSRLWEARHRDLMNGQVCLVFCRGIRPVRLHWSLSFPSAISTAAPSCSLPASCSLTCVISFCRKFCWLAPSHLSSAPRSGGCPVLQQKWQKILVFWEMEKPSAFDKVHLVTRNTQTSLNKNWTF